VSEDAGRVSIRVQGQRKTGAAETSDGSLVQQALAGDQEAFEALVQRYRVALFRLVYRYVGERDEVNDVLRQVWLQLYLSLSVLCGCESIKPWLFKVAHNCSIDALRRRRALPFSQVEASDGGDEDSWLDSIPDVRPTPEEEALVHDLQRSLVLAIRSLPKKQRPVVLLYYENQLSFPEIGHILDRPYSTVRTQFRRAKASLRMAVTAELQAASVPIEAEVNTYAVAG
jgi:RNA polymerase sigma factor (sigma-70 family)